MNVRDVSLEDVSEMEQYNPFCPCSDPQQLISSSAYMKIPIIGNMTANLCGTLIQLQTFCSPPTPREPPRVNCTQTLPGALAWSYLNFLGYVCEEINDRTGLQTISFMNTSLGSQLLMPGDYERLVNAAALATMQAALTEANIAIAPLEFGHRAFAATVGDRSEGSLVQSPPGCSCSGADASTSILRLYNQPCLFKAAFDTRNSSVADTWWDCNSVGSMMIFPQALFLDPAFYSLLSIPPPYASLMGFAGADGVNETSTFIDFLYSWAEVIFTQNADGTVSPEQLRPGIVEMDYGQHFASCSPQTCTYSYRGRPRFLQAFTTALGTISGLYTVLIITVDRLYDWLWKPKAPPQDADAEAETEAEGVGVAGLLGTADADGRGSGHETVVAAGPVATGYRPASFAYESTTAVPLVAVHAVSRQPQPR